MVPSSKHTRTAIRISLLNKDEEGQWAQQAEAFEIPQACPPKYRYDCYSTHQTVNGHYMCIQANLEEHATVELLNTPLE